jgi:DNA-binding protein H-NS
MSKLSNIPKQIAALEAQAARITKEEMESAVGKVKALMADFGLTIEHLTESVTGKLAGKKPKSTPKNPAAKKATPAAKYADPKSGKTWSGFGRAPGWIAGVKSRDAFLVNKAAAPTADAKTVPGKKKVGAKKAAKAAVAPAKKAAKTVAKKAVPLVDKSSPSARKSAAGVKKAIPKKAAPVKKAAPKKSVAKKAVTASPASAASASAPVAA